jgi:hypothetical protein
VTVSENIRVLAQQGLTVAEIARRLGIRYQHAYKVLKTDQASTPASTGAAALKPKSSIRVAASPKPPLTVETLLAGGFKLSSRWLLSVEGDLKLDPPLPKEVGVYAFVKKGAALYVGVATMGLAKRIYFYAKPASTQTTSQRLNKILKTELGQSEKIDIYTAIPPDQDWNGLPVHGAAGLELGLIKKYELPWNKRSAK